MTRHTQHWHGARSVAGPVDEGGCCADQPDVQQIGQPCDQPLPHDPHFYQRFIAGGEPGPVPSTTHACPGRALFALVSDYRAGVDPTPTDETNGRQIGAQRRDTRENR